MSFPGFRFILQSVQLTLNNPIRDYAFHGGLHKVTDCTQLRTRIETLRPGMGPEEFERARREMLAMIDGSNGNGSSSKSDAPSAKLSRREQEVMTMMLSGQRLKEIAAHLDISVKTVTTHRARLMKKLRVEDNLGLYRYGIRNGLISV